MHVIFENLKLRRRIRLIHKSYKNKLALEANLGTD